MRDGGWVLGRALEGVVSRRPFSYLDLGVGSVIA